MQTARPELGESPSGFSDAPSPAYVADFMSTSEGLQLMKAFVRIKDPKVRRRIVELAAALAGEEEIQSAGSI